VNDRIVIDENVCNGKPIIKGTRITVQSILEFLSAGDDYNTILKAYPSLKMEDIQACLQFASFLMSQQYRIKPVA
jgi:uncharacterized protein (DUF433 family)